MKIGLFGTYDRHAPRLLTLLAGLKKHGVEIIECHAALWPESVEREGVARAPWRWLPRWLEAQKQLWVNRGLVKTVDGLLVPYPGYADVWLASRVARKLGVPLIFDPFISLFDTVVGDRRVFSEKALNASFLKAIDRFALCLSDVVLADTPQMGEFYRRLGCSRRVIVVPVGADERIFKFAPEPVEPVVVTFIGTNLPLHGVDTILGAAKLLENEPSIRFHLVGPASLATAMGPNIAHTPYVPYEQLGQIYGSSHICLGAFGESAKAERVVPQKLYQAAAVGRAIVTRTSSAVADAFGEQSVLMVPPGDPVALSDAIRYLAHRPEARSALAQAANTTFETNYTSAAIALCLLDALR